MSEEEYNYEDNTPETDKALNAAVRALNNLNKQLNVIREQYPEANYYMACETMNILHHNSHQDREPDQGDTNVMESVLIEYADCGEMVNGGLRYV